MAPTSKLNANGVEIGVIGETMGENAYLSLTDIARYKNPDEPKAVVANWMRLRSTIEFLGLWEQIHNPDFKGLEFDALKMNLVVMLLHYLHKNGFHLQML